MKKCIGWTMVVGPLALLVCYGMVGGVFWQILASFAGGILIAIWVWAALELIEP